MDTTVLVDRDIENGRRLIDDLDRSKFVLDGALWFYFAETGEWRLLLVSPLVDTIGPKRCYTVIQSAIEDLPQDFRISLERISVISPKDNLVRLLRIAISTGRKISTIRFTRNTINGVFIEDALIYRLMAKTLAEYTDKELEKSIEVHETEIAKDKQTKIPTKDLLDGIKAKESFLKQLYAERDRRRDKK